MRIDAHQHYWNPARGDYGWMPPDEPRLNRPYLPSDLAPQLAAGAIGGTILVQAAPSVAETEYLLGIADCTPSVLGVVGWVDFDRPGEIATLRRLARHPKFRGVRPMIQDIADPEWMLGAKVQWGFAALSDLGLRLDALGFPRHLAPFAELMRRHPGLRVVVDHCMKPEIASDQAAADAAMQPASPPADDADPAATAGFAAWAAGMAELARLGAWCKLSGLVTEAAPDRGMRDLGPYAAHVLAAFGAERVMWGSDWPVCRLRCEYGEWLAAAEALCADLAPSARARIFGGSAAAFYGIAADQTAARGR